MAHNTDLIANIEALLAVAKSYNDIDLSENRGARLDLLGKVEALHYQLDNPADAMFRQIMNVKTDTPPRLDRGLREQRADDTRYPYSTPKPLP
jgi:hypothetical protein